MKTYSAKTISAKTIGGWDVDALNFFNVVTILTGAQKTSVNSLVQSLKANSLWTKFYAIYPIVGGTAASHSYNLKNPYGFRITWVGGVTHTANGVDFDGTTGYGKTGLIPNTTMTINNTGFDYYSREDSVGATVGFGAVNSGTQQIRMFMGTTYTSYQYDSTGGSVAGTIADTVGLLSINRLSSISHSIHKSGILIASNTTSGGTLPTVELYFGAANSAGTPANFNNRQCAFASIRQGLTTTETATLNTIVENYQS